MTEEQQMVQETKERKIQRERRLQTLMIGACTACAPVGIAALWWCMQQLTAVPELVKRIDAIDAKLYTRLEAEKDVASFETRLSQMKRQNDLQDTKLDNIDRRVLIIETNQALRGSK